LQPHDDSAEVRLDQPMSARHGTTRDNSPWRGGPEPGGGQASLIRDPFEQSGAASFVTRLAGRREAPRGRLEETPRGVTVAGG
jgi:hypothetical protein